MSQFPLSHRLRMPRAMQNPPIEAKSTNFLDIPYSGLLFRPPRLRWIFEEGPPKRVSGGETLVRGGQSRD